MTDLPIEDLGVHEAAFTAALGTIGYPVPVDRATITVPALFIDIPLVGDGTFELRIDSLKSNFNNAGNQRLALVFSGDGGVTFHNNMTTNGTYNHNGYYIDEGNQTLVASEGAAMNVGLVNLRGTVETVNGVLNIMPGSTTKNPSVRFKGWTDYAEDMTNNGVAAGFCIDMVGLCGNQLPVPNNGFNPTGRQNLVRLIWAGSSGQDANPPPEESSFEAGSWSLFRYP